MSCDQLREAYLANARYWLGRAVMARGEGKLDTAARFVAIARNCEWQAGRLR